MQATLFSTQAATPLERAEAQRRGNVIYVDEAARARLGQYATPAPIARVMAEMLLAGGPEGEIRLLDPGVGAGALTLAVLERLSAKHAADVTVSAYDVDPHAASLARRHVGELSGGRQFGTVSVQDYLTTPPPTIGYTHAILNPPYKKFSTRDPRQANLREAGISTVNLYAAFVWKAITELAPGGRLVAIVPRSFANGSYYRSFRRFLRKHTELLAVKLFDDRRAAFAHDSVLQENVIVSLVKRTSGPASSPPHHVSLLSGDAFEVVEQTAVAAADAWWDEDGECLLRIDSRQRSESLPPARLTDLGLSVSTGPVVDFRAAQHLRPESDPEAYPLLRPRHFSAGRCHWPRATGKRAGGIVLNDDTRSHFWPAGTYVVVRRISSKEEPRRVVASLLSPGDFEHDLLCFENHLNVFHDGRRGIDSQLARGLCAYLNSETVDRFLRTISGHTQINATDLRVLPYPTRESLMAVHPPRES